MHDLSVVIITRNEEKNIRRCLESVKEAGEIVIADSQSIDQTKKIASEFTSQIFDCQWMGFGPTKEWAKAKAQKEWVLSIDADEVVTEKLRDEITQIINYPNSKDGYFIPRRSNFLGKWIKHSGWYPDYVLRLFKKEKGRFDNSMVHEKVIVDGEVGYLKNELLHYTDPDLEHYLEKLNYYTTLSAKELFKQSKKAKLSDLLFRPPSLFLKMYIAKKGFLDGWHGLVLALFSGFHVLTKYAKLWHLNHKKIS